MVCGRMPLADNKKRATTGISKADEHAARRSMIVLPHNHNEMSTMGPLAGALAVISAALLPSFTTSARFGMSI